VAVAAMTGPSLPGSTMSSRLVLGTVVLVALLIGLNFSMLKFALDHTTPILLASMRTVIGGTFLLGLAFLRGEKFPRHKEDLFNIWVVGLSITTVSSALLIVGVNKVPAGVASLIASTMPMFTAALSLVLLSVAISRLGFLGLAVGFVGTLVLASPSLSGSTAIVGIVTMLFSALAWAFGNVYMKWKDLSRVSPIMLVGVQLYMSAAMLIPVALLVEGTAETDWSFGLFWPVLYAAVPANAITFSLLATVVRRATPTQAASSAYLIPVFGVFFGWLIRSERLGLAEVIGGVLVVIGVYVLVNDTARQQMKAATSE